MSKASRRLETMTVYKAGEEMVVNESDVAKWVKKGWSTKRDATPSTDGSGEKSGGEGDGDGDSGKKSSGAKGNGSSKGGSSAKGSGSGEKSGG